MIQICSRITRIRVLNGETYTNSAILQVNLFAFAYILINEDFSSLDGSLHGTQLFFQLYTH